MKTTEEADGLHGVALAVIALGVVVAGLVLGQSFLVPIAIAIFLWNVLEAIIQGFENLRLGPYRLPRGLAILLGIAAIAAGVHLVIAILLGQADALSTAWPRYVERFDVLISDFTQWLGPERSAKIKETISAIDLTSSIPGFLASTQSVVINVLLVIAYVGFLFAERGHMPSKIAAMFPESARAHDASRLFGSISQSVRQYIWIKTLVSVFTGLSCYVVLRWIGIDFAETWALLIFVLNYIPNIGSIIAVAFPAMIALVQFDSPTPFLMLVGSLAAIQLTIGSVLEPMLMGSSLNMSPLAIILGLAFWGTIWGIVGAFLSVPILVVIMIVCAHIPSWRWVAVLLSKDGRIANTD